MMVTEQPWRASTRAVPLPQPLLPPTQSATLPVRALAVLAVCTSVNVGIDPGPAARRLGGAYRGKLVSSELTA